uniref:NADH-ubiquinone oxidoreductase chain 6 n=4 Tax=Colletotrichum gloeosporioides species complex TaxID=2707338 RepID=A0A1S6LNK0_COLGL|nr:NADH dehydrogenase subunit 6 [Colletotrichum fructicola]AQT39483.1 NADH dehydrogenase subunit 6 [Colletotrichum siamense]AQT39573.1 NADH dehydrogenase subunit 6 [Colletotrichum gloeosporioides]AQT39588.1 NADH dehydrogenase subunit 6 [Colletotrichum aenigma]AQT39498.1 NADH dehydrogenase subunit 6 [Colletotrichum siamense]
MNNLFIIDEIYTSGFKTGALDIVSVFAIICAILTIVSKNPIVSVLFLIGLFGGVSSYLILLGLNFIGLSYLIVYIGAVSILFLFILMLINIRISELQSNTKNSIPLALFITIFFNYLVFQFLPYDLAILNNTQNGSALNNVLYHSFSNPIPLTTSGTETVNSDLFFATSSSWDGNLIETSHISTIGNILYTSHSMWLLLASFILLLAMIGAIVITIKPKNKRD